MDVHDQRRFQMAAKNAKGEILTMSSNILNKIMFMSYHLQMDGWFGHIVELIQVEGEKSTYKTIYTFPSSEQH